MRVFPWSAVILAIVPAGEAWAAPPEIRSTVPAGVQRGVETQLTLYGPGFGPGMGPGRRGPGMGPGFGPWHQGQ